MMKWLRSFARWARPSRPSSAERDEALRNEGAARRGAANRGRLQRRQPGRARAVDRARDVPHPHVARGCRSHAGDGAAGGPRSCIKATGRAARCGRRAARTGNASLNVNRLAASSAPAHRGGRRPKGAVIPLGGHCSMRGDRARGLSTWQRCGSARGISGHGQFSGAV